MGLFTLHNYCVTCPLDCNKVINGVLKSTTLFQCLRELILRTISFMTLFYWRSSSLTTWYCKFWPVCFFSEICDFTNTRKIIPMIILERIIVVIIGSILHAYCEITDTKIVYLGQNLQCQLAIDIQSKIFIK